MGVVFKCPEHEPDIHVDAFVVSRSPIYIRCEGFLVAVEGESDDFAPGIEHRTSRVAACDVIVREEIDRKVKPFVLCFCEKILPFRKEVEIIGVGVLLGKYF